MKQGITWKISTETILEITATKDAMASKGVKI